MDKIKNGETVKGIKQIPDKVHGELEASISKLSVIRKPWEL
jgi:hypothetical protein